MADEQDTVHYDGPSGGWGSLRGIAGVFGKEWANANLVVTPDSISDDQPILMSDILPTGWFGAALAEIEEGDHVLVFGCGPVGQMAIASALVMGGKVIAIDRLADRLDMARRRGAQVINFDEVDVPEAVLKLTDGDGARRVIDAVGVDAQHAHAGPDEPGVHGKAKELVEQYAIEPAARKFSSTFRAGDNPSPVADWSVECVAKGGTVSIIGVNPPTDRTFPIGMAMNKNLTLPMGNCNHRACYGVLIDHVTSGRLDPVKVLTETEPMTGAIEAYKAFDERRPGWIKVELEPAA